MTQDCNIDGQKDMKLCHTTDKLRPANKEGCLKCINSTQTAHFLIITKH